MLRSTLAKLFAMLIEVLLKRFKHFGDPKFSAFAQKLQTDTHVRGVTDALGQTHHSQSFHHVLPPSCGAAARQGCRAITRQVPP